MFCIITALYVPILSAVVLIFTGLRMRATLKLREAAQRKLHQTKSRASNNVASLHPASARAKTGRSHCTGSRRTLKIITFTGVAYFTCWGPYAVVTLTQMLVSSFSPPSGVQFAVMWLANSNSAVNVFIYSYTNVQFRRQCFLLASRIFGSRFSAFVADKRSAQNRPGDESALSASNRSTTINRRMPVPAVVTCIALPVVTDR